MSQVHPQARTTRLCQATGTTHGIQRLYETEGLIPVPQCSAAGCRHFPADTVGRVRAILLLDAVAGGDMQLLQADAECRFLLDFLAAAPWMTASAA